MAIGNQLELGVVLHGFGRANEALGVLKQTFSSLKQACFYRLLIIFYAAWETV